MSRPCCLIVAAFRGTVSLTDTRGEMRPLARTSLGPSLVGMLTAFLIGGFVLPANSQGGCISHYVTSRNSGQTEGRLLERLVAEGAVSLPQGEMPFNRRPPCSGALCSGNPAAPVSTTPSVPPSSLGQWALPAFLVALDHQEDFRRLPIDENLSPVAHPSSIFHPPRSRALSITA